MTRLIVVLFAVLLAPGLSAADIQLGLREALDTAAKLNPEIQISHLKVLEQQANAAVAQSAYEPQLNLRIGGAYQTNNLQGIGLIFPGFPSRIGPYRTFDARPVLTQTVIDLSLLSSIRAERARTEAASRQVEVTRQETLAAVLQLYLQALQAESRVTAAEARIRTAEAVLEQTNQLETAGAASKLDIARAQQQVDNERVAFETAGRDRGVLKSLLLRTVGIEDIDGTVTLTAPVPKGSLALPGEATAAAMEHRDELRVNEASTRAAREEYVAARRQRFPRLTAAGDYGLLGVGPEQSVSTYSVGAQLTIPLWTGRRIEAQIAQAQSRIGQAEQELRSLKLRIAQEVRQAEIELRASRNALTAAERSTAAARTALELARLRFSAGLATNIDTIVAQGTLSQAEDQEIRTRYETQLARARLARATGDIYSFFN